MHPGQKRAAGTCVVAIAFSRQRDRGAQIETGQHQEPLAERTNWLQDGAQDEPRALGPRRPLRHHHSVRHIDNTQPADRHRGRIAARDKRRDHAVEQRQRQAGTDAAKNRPPRYRFSGDHHGSSDLLIWNGGLRTIPMMRDDQRWLLGAASRTIRRIAGASKYSTPRPRAYVMSFSATVVTNSSRRSSNTWR